HKQNGQFALPENEWENLVADIWKRALGVNEVGRQDNFFDIGGHSLLVIQVLKELREHEKVTKAVQMTDLFRHTTIEALARFIASEGDGEPAQSGAKAASSRVAARKAAMSRRRRR
ncbi:MAG: phosphopantetheine-binding protein, partial [Oleiphilaceae bacterium]|nr:phosphopantetheine-binding protein [Oleiphilaceae bacterium]